MAALPPGVDSSVGSYDTSGGGRWHWLSAASKTRSVTEDGAPRLDISSVELGGEVRGGITHSFTLGNDLLPAGSAGVWGSVDGYYKGTGTVEVGYPPDAVTFDPSTASGLGLYSDEKTTETGQSEAYFEGGASLGVTLAGGTPTSTAGASFQLTTSVTVAGRNDSRRRLGQGRQVHETRWRRAGHVR